MSLLHVKQIEGQLIKLFSGLIDLSDYKGASTEQQKAVFLTRALVAYALMNLTEMDPAGAAAAVTDGTGDNGIDGIHYDPNEGTLYLVQSKWHNDGHGSIELGDLRNFTAGLHDLINTDYDRFNSKVQALKSSIDEALLAANTRIVLVLAYSGQEDLAEDQKHHLDKLLEEMNDPTDLLSTRILKQEQLHNFIAKGVKGEPINLEIALTEWGQTREPYDAVYGQVSAADVARWWELYHQRLFAPNLRVFLGKTEVNDYIIETIRNEPENVWYFNNGVTALVRAFRKKPIGGPSRDSGVFECEDLLIVNGAQTVGSIATAYMSDKTQVENARVLLRIISLEKCPADMAANITRFTNTQNRIESKDFVALDPEQERIRTEASIDGVYYAYKAGDHIPQDQQGFDLTEATISLACSQSEVGLAVQAKREIGRLWEDITKAPYKALFNPSVTGANLWERVRMLRTVDGTLAQEQKALTGRNRLFAVHGNRFVTWLVFKMTPQLSSDQLTDIQDRTKQCLLALRTLVNKQYPDVYLGSLFKNQTKCKQLAAEISKNLTAS